MRPRFSSSSGATKATAPRRAAIVVVSAAAPPNSSSTRATPSTSSKKTSAIVDSSSSLAARAVESSTALADALKKSRARVAELEAEVAELRAAAASPPHAEESPSGSSSSTIILRYSSGWKDVFAHFSRDGGGWTDLPGVRLADASSSSSSSFASSSGSVPPPPLPGDREIRIDGVERRLDFVMNDGEGDWDGPDPYFSDDSGGSGSEGGGRTGRARHYTIEVEGGGCYRLKSGKLTKLA